LQGTEVGLDSLLRNWGGEGMYWSKGNERYEDNPRQPGGPTVVVVSVDLSSNWDDHFVTPPLSKVFVGRLLGMEDLVAEVHYKAQIPPDQIVEFWRPGCPEYDRLEGFPSD
jgi:hypothetical protein